MWYAFHLYFGANGEAKSKVRIANSSTYSQNFVLVLANFQLSF